MFGNVIEYWNIEEIAIKHKRKPSDNVWSMNAPLGKNSIGKILKMAAKRKGLQGN